MVEPRDVFVALQARLDRPGTPVLERLREVRDARGRIGGDDLAQIAGELRWPVAAVTGAATFYADFAGGPRGRRHVRVCEGTSCFASTQRRHVQDLEQVLGVRCGERTPDGSVSLQAVRCLGYCYDSPAVVDGERPASGADLGGTRPDSA